MILVVRNADGRIMAAFADAESMDGFDFPDCAIVPAPEGYDASQAFLIGGALSRDIEAVRAQKWAAIKTEREARRIVAATSYGIFDCDETGKSNMLGQQQAIELLGEAVAEPITWKLHDNSFVQLTRAQFTDACLQVLASIQATYAASFALEAAISAAATIEDVEAVTWPAS